MKSLTALLLLALLALLLTACGIRPPRPPECEGQLTPINKPTTSVPFQSSR